MSDENWRPPVGPVDPDHPECAAVVAEVSLLLDGEAVNACLVAVGQCAGRSVERLDAQQAGVTKARKQRGFPAEARVELTPRRRPRRGQRKQLERDLSPRKKIVGQMHSSDAARAQ